MKFDFYIESKEDVKNAVKKFGILPFFANSIAGFSIEEHVSPDVWFTDKEGVWEWKGPVIRECSCAYGKFFEKKAAFVSSDLFPDLANFRRDGYDFDARFEDGLASFRERDLYELLDGNAPVLSKILKAEGNYRKGGKVGFETLITRLQEQCYVLIDDFVYERDKHGKPYGWGVAEYSTPERFFGEAFRKSVYTRKPEESRERLLAHVSSLFPDENPEKIVRFLK